MADRNTIFMLDDIDEQELGGFNDMPELPVDGDQTDTKTTDTGNEHADPEKDDDQPEEQPKVEQDPAVDQKQVKDTPKVEQKPEPAVFDVNTAIATVAKLTEQNNKLMEQLNRKDAPKQEAPSAPEKPVFTQNQWDDDPQGCNEALFEYYDKKRVYESQINEDSERAASEQQKKLLEASHQEAWTISLEIMPELKTNEKARKAWAAIYNHPNAGFANDPNGPLKATTALRKFMAEKKLSFDDTPSAEQQTTDPKPDNNTETARRAAEDEAARQRRVRNQAMHTGGKGGKSTINLTPEQVSVCRQMNISEQSYADSLAALGWGR